MGLALPSRGDGNHLGVPYEQVPSEVQPIVLGRFKFPDKRRMILEVRSFQRAYEGVKFFGPVLGPQSSPNGRAQSTAGFRGRRSSTGWTASTACSTRT